MKLRVLLIQDFLKTGIATWLILVLFELFNPGMVQRYINLEYWLYALIIVYLTYQVIDN